MLSVIMLSVVMLSVVMLSVIMLNVTYKPFVLSVVILSFLKKMTSYLIKLDIVSTCKVRFIQKELKLSIQ